MDPPTRRLRRGRHKIETNCCTVSTADDANKQLGSAVVDHRYSLEIEFVFVRTDLWKENIADFG
jgi:hypothetical protein